MWTAEFLKEVERVNLRRTKLLVKIQEAFWATARTNAPARQACPQLMVSIRSLAQQQFKRVAEASLPSLGISERLNPW